MPYDSDDNDVACKYPFNSVALLCADIKEITELLFEATIVNTFGEASEMKQFSKSFEFCNFEIISNDENITKEYNVIQHFFSFLENKHNNCNNVLCGYFYQIFRFLIEKEKEIIIDILFNKDKHHIKNMINLTHNTSICKCIAEILNKNYQHKQKYISYKTYICNQLLTNKIYIKENINTICEDIFIPLFSSNSVYLTSTMNTNINFKEFYFVSFFTKLKVIKVTHRSIAKMCYMIANAIIEGIEFEMNETVQNNVINNNSNTNNNDFIMINNESNVEIDKQKYICKTLYNNKKEVIEFLTETSHSFVDYITNNNYNNYFDIIYITNYLVQFFSIVKYYMTNNNNSNSNNNNTSQNENEYNCSNSIVKNIFTEKLYLTLTVKLLENPSNNIYHTAYIDLITSIKEHSDILINKIVINKFMTYLVDIYPKHRELLAPIVRILAIIFENYDCNNDTYKEDSFKTMCCNLKKFADSVNALFLENPVQSKDDLENDEEGNVVMKKPLIVHEHSLNDLINNGIKQYLKLGCDEEEVESENISEFVENDNNNVLNKNNTEIEESEIEECISIEEDINETNVNQEPQIEVKETEIVIETENVNVNSD